MLGFPLALKALSVGMILVATFVGVALPAAGQSVASASGVQQWAYGAHTNLTTSWTNATGSYQLAGFFGWDVLLTQTNTSANSFELTAQRAMALQFSLTACKIPCGTTDASASVAYRAWESETGTANFTQAGYVYENGVAQPALAIVNATDVVSGGVVENWSAALHALLLQRTVSGALNVTAGAHLAVNFSPALGLAPISSSPGDVWNASSHFEAEGGWIASAAYVRTPWNQTSLRGSGSLSGNVSGSGSVAIAGTDAGPLTLADGTATEAVSLTVFGPFALREGFLLLPVEADPFGGGGEAWSTYANGTAQAATSMLDLAGHVPHLGLLASATAFAPQPAPASALGPQPLVSPTPSATDGAGVVQAQPESVSQSQAGIGCLVAGTCPTPTIPGQTGRTNVLGGIVLVGAILAVGILVAVLIAERRRLPPPRHPNAALYPPGVALSPAPPSPPATPPRGTPPPPEDPLGHLW